MSTATTHQNYLEVAGPGMGTAAHPRSRQSIRIGRLRRMLEEACALAPLRLELLTPEGDMLTAAGPAELRDGRPELVLPVETDSAVAAQLVCYGSAANLHTIAALVAARLADHLVAEEEIDSLASEILHTYDTLHVVYDLTAALGLSLDLASIGAAVIERILPPLEAIFARLIIIVDGVEQTLVERSRVEQRAIAVAPGASASVPLLYDGETIGRIDVLGKSGGEHFTSSDLKLLEAVAAIAAGAIEHARLRRHELVLCDQVRADIARVSLDLEPLLERVAERIVESFQYASASCWLIEDDQLVRKAAAGTLPLPERVGLAVSAGAQAIATGQHILVSRRMRQGGSEAPDLPHAAVAYLYIPLIRSGSPIGVLQITDTESLSTHDLYLMESIVVQVNTAIDNALLVAEIRRTNMELVQASKLVAVGTLAAGVSHEFNNVLTGIQGYAELGLSHTHVDKDDVLRSILRVSQRGAHITRGLLTFARPQPTARTLIDLKDVVHESLHLVEHTLTRRGITITLRLRDECYVLGDMTQLMQVIVNLLTNARDAMSAESGMLTLAIREDEQRYYLDVTDTGCGIPEHYIDRIFEPFVTTKGALGGSATSGTGLGLSVSYSIATAHQGELRVQSQVGLGSTFTLALPRAKHADSLETAEPTTTAPAIEQRALDVLIVEDEPDVRRFIGMMLARSGHRVNAVPDGGAALLACLSKRWDVIISDLMMPGLDGLTLINGLRERGDQTPVVLITGREDVLADLPQLPPQTFALAKPFVADDLLGCIATALA